MVAMDGGADRSSAAPGGGNSPTDAAIFSHRPAGTSETGAPEHGRHLEVSLHLGAATRAVGQMGFDLPVLFGLGGMEGIRPQQLLDLFVDHRSVPLTAASSSRPMRRRPDRMRLLIVPSGSFSMAATSL